MKNKFLNIHSSKKVVYQVDEITDELLSEVNALKINGPNVPLKKEDIHVRSMYCIGEAATSKLSIHPEGLINGKEVKVLSRLSELLIGAPMMVGHNTEATPWARVFKTSINERDGEKVVKASYYFLSGVEKYDAIAREIDAGIRSEGSISYFFDAASCSICHAPLEIMSWFGMVFHDPTCKHVIGNRYGSDKESQMCYYYPVPESISMVGELSHVYRGAYPNTAVAPNKHAVSEAMLSDAGSSFALDEHVKLWSGKGSEFADKKEVEPCKLFNSLLRHTNKSIQPAIYSIEKAKTLSCSKAEPLTIEPRYDGYDVTVSKVNGTVSINASEKDITGKFPGIAKELSGVESDNFMVSGCIIKMNGKKRLELSDVYEYLSDSDDVDDCQFRLKISDVLVFDNVDKTSLKFSERILCLSESILKENLKQVHKVKHLFVSSDSDLSASFDKIVSRHGSIIRNANGKYIDGAVSEYCARIEIVCKVEEVSTRGDDKYSYSVSVVGSDGKPVEFCKTFASAIKLAVGDIARVSVESVKKDSATDTLTVCAPTLLYSLPCDKDCTTYKTLSSLADDGTDDDDEEDNDDESDTMTCPDCGAEFVFDDEPKEADGNVKCPECGILINASGEKVEEESEDEENSESGEGADNEDNEDSGDSDSDNSNESEDSGDVSESHFFVLSRHSKGQNLHFDLLVKDNESGIISGFAMQSNPLSISGSQTKIFSDRLISCSSEMFDKESELVKTGSESGEIEILSTGGCKLKEIDSSLVKVSFSEKIEKLFGALSFYRLNAPSLSINGTSFSSGKSDKFLWVSRHSSNGEKQPTICTKYDASGNLVFWEN